MVLSALQMFYSLRWLVYKSLVNKLQTEFQHFLNPPCISSFFSQTNMSEKEYWQDWGPYIIGVTSIPQLLQNLEMLPNITDQDLGQIDEVLANGPEPFVCVSWTLLLPCALKSRDLVPSPSTAAHTSFVWEALNLTDMQD